MFNERKPREKYQVILQRTGIILVVIGTIDIAYTIWCLLNSIPYSSDFNILAIVAGIFLLKGNLKAARIIRWFMAFFLGRWTLTTLAFPLFFPDDYLLTLIRLRLIPTIGATITQLVVLGIIYGIFKQLNSPLILQAQRDRRIANTNIYLPLALGSFFSLLIFVFMFTGETAKEILVRAEKEYGSEYQYVIKSLGKSVSSSSGKSVSAIVTAYNKKEIKDIAIQWER